MSDTVVLENTALVQINLNPVAVYTDTTAFDAYFEQVRQKYADGFVADVTTDKGRKEVASQAFKITKEKTALVAAGKKLTEEARQMIKAVNDARNGMEERLDTLAKEVRKPLTEWEAAEEARIARCEDAVKQLRAHATVSFDETAAQVGERIKAIESAVIDEAEFGEFFDLANSLRETAISALTAAFARLTKEEADRAELERLRAENEARLAREAEEREAARMEAEREAAAAAEKAREEQLAAERAAQAEADRLAAIEAEKAKVAAAAEEARLQALRDAEEEAARELAEQEARAAEERRLLQEAHEAELAKAQKERDDAIAEQRRQDEERKRADEAAAALAEERRREDEARTQDRAHRSRIMGAAKEALMASCDLTEPVAKQIVLSICAGDIPNISLRF